MIKYSAILENLEKDSEMLKELFKESQFVLDAKEIESMCKEAFSNNPMIYARAFKVDVKNSELSNDKTRIKYIGIAFVVDVAKSIRNGVKILDTYKYGLEIFKRWFVLKENKMSARKMSEDFSDFDTYFVKIDYDALKENEQFKSVRSINKFGL